MARNCRNIFLLLNKLFNLRNVLHSTITQKERTPYTDWSRDCMGQPTLIAKIEKILGHESGTPCRFCRGRWYHHQLAKGGRTLDRGQQMHSLIQFWLLLVFIYVYKVAKGTSDNCHIDFAIIIKNKGQTMATTAVVSLNKTVSLCTQNKRINVIDRKLWKAHFVSYPFQNKWENYTAFSHVD